MAKLFVIAGHGAGDPGACGNGYSEAERVRALAQRIKTLGGNNVTLGDVNRNYYADNGISTLNISKDYQINKLPRSKLRGISLDLASLGIFVKRSKLRGIRPVSD